LEKFAIEFVCTVIKLQQISVLKVHNPNLLYFSANCVLVFCKLGNFRCVCLSRLNEFLHFAVRWRCNVWSICQTHLSSKRWNTTCRYYLHCSWMGFT